MAKRKSKKQIHGFAEAVAFVGLCFAAAACEIAGHKVVWLWIFIVFWASFSNWGRG